MEFHKNEQTKNQTRNLGENASIQKVNSRVLRMGPTNCSEKSGHTIWISKSPASANVL